jgi:hypothetical protein
MKGKSMKSNSYLFKVILILAAAVYICVPTALYKGVEAQTPTPTGTPVPTGSPTASPLKTATATPKPTATSETTPIPKPSTSPAASVSGVYNQAFKDDKDNNKRLSAGIGDIIIIEVKNLKSLLRKAKCLDEKDVKITANCKEQDIALFLEGRKIDKLSPESGAPEIEVDQNGTLQYHLQRNSENDEAWADLLGAPFSSNRERTYVSVGLENEYPIDKVMYMNLTRIHWDLRLLGLLIPVGMLFWLLWLAPKTNLLRDIGDSPAKGVLGKNGKPAMKPFSLARCQMAFWFFLVIISFLFIWLITGAFDIITSSVLALIGISAGTALGAAVIDVGKKPELANQLTAEKTKLEEESTKLKTQINTTPPPANVAELQNTLAEMQNKWSKVLNKISDLLKPQESGGFFNDLLTDENGDISFHRFQIFIWTIVLGFLFVSSVYSRLSMPEFSATLLALLGISSGTYLGFKLPERQ